uniref:Uncharacterized protein n=1 Tax=Tetranychus urticae TaxID=32264 RepID=T1KLW0_TETUR
MCVFKMAAIVSKWLQIERRTKTKESRERQSELTRILVSPN